MKGSIKDEEMIYTCIFSVNDRQAYSEKENLNSPNWSPIYDFGGKNGKVVVNVTNDLLKGISDY